MQLLPVQDRGYAHPELLAETDWLAGRLTDPKLRVIDARQPEQYATNHIPGAVNLSGFGGILIALFPRVCVFLYWFAGGRFRWYLRQQRHGRTTKVLPAERSETSVASRFRPN